MAPRRRALGIGRPRSGSAVRSWWVGQPLADRDAQDAIV